MKYLVVIANGLTDRPIAEKDNKTPLQLANTPHLDRLVREGRSGSVQTVPETFHTGSDVSYLSLLGYDPQENYCGPGYFDALAMGVSLKDGEIPLCCDFVTLQASHNDMVMKDFTAGRLPCDESREYLQALQKQITDCAVTFHPGLSYHNLMVLESRPFSKRLEPPNELIGEGIRRFMPGDDQFKDLVYILNQAQIILHNHPGNQRRQRENRDPVNSIWLWGNGEPGPLPSFESKFGKAGSVVTASLLLKGMARAADMKTISVEGATGFAETNYRGKVEAALNELESRDVVYLNVAGAEEVSLKGNIDDKILTIEDIDSEVVGPLLKEAGSKADVKIMVVVNHMSSAVAVKYGKERVPFAIYPDTRADATDKFDENLLHSGTDHFNSGPDLMNAFFEVN
ncbi:phosphoglycerate mutase [Candidatus Nitromaritima sp. SCGC AAA799-A02]|nr:phosphoglycerate mutase [Candidatus Nitromaritima sp. SCGC AAA799-A02]